MASGVSSVKVVTVRIQVISGPHWFLTKSNRCAERRLKAVPRQLAEREDAPPNVAWIASANRAVLTDYQLFAGWQSRSKRGTGKVPPMRTLLGGALQAFDMQDLEVLWEN